MPSTYEEALERFQKDIDLMDSYISITILLILLLNQMEMLRLLYLQQILAYHFLSGQSH